MEYKTDFDFLYSIKKKLINLEKFEYQWRYLFNHVITISSGIASVLLAFHYREFSNPFLLGVLLGGFIVGMFLNMFEFIHMTRIIAQLRRRLLFIEQKEINEWVNGTINKMGVCLYEQMLQKRS